MRGKRTDHPFDVVARQAARTQQQRCVAEAADDRRFEADLRGSAVQYRIDRAAEIGQDMRGGRWAYPARAVGRRAGEGKSETLQQAPRERMGRHAQGHAVEAGAGEIADRAAGARGHHKGQRPWPERFRKGLGGAIETALAPGRLRARHVGDEGIEARPLLGRVDAGDRFGVAGVGAEAVDRLRGKGHQPAGAEYRLRPRQPSLARA
jgi:hypothetical protein